MAGAPAQASPFRAERYHLAGSGLILGAVTTDEAHALGPILAGIDPWHRYGISAASISGLLSPVQDGGIRLAARDDTGALRAVVVVRQPWLVGPYLQFLAVLPGGQGRGLGTAMLEWFEAEARTGGARNLWVCVTAFNDGGRRFYERHGFEPAAQFEDLILTGVDEILLRKRLSPSDS